MPRSLRVYSPTTGLKVGSGLDKVTLRISLGLRLGSRSPALP